MNRPFRFVLPACILFSLTVLPCMAAAPNPVSVAEIDAVPCNPDATQDVKSVLKYLAGHAHPSLRAIKWILFSTFWSI